MRVAVALDCCDREAMSFIASTVGVTGADMHDPMLAAVKRRFGPVNQLPQTIEWLNDNSSCYVARDTRALARKIRFEQKTTLFRSPQSNGMAEAFVRTFKRDYARVNETPAARTVLLTGRQLGRPTLSKACFPV